MPTTVLHASTSNYALKSTKHGKQCIQPVDADGSEPSDDASHAMKTTKSGRPFLQVITRFIKPLTCLLN